MEHLDHIIEGALALNLQAARAPATLRAYERAWWRFENAARCRGESSLPADPWFVAEYLSELGEVHAPATVRATAAAIAHYHATADETSPTAHPCVRQALAGGDRRHFAGAQRQAEALTEEVFFAVAEAAYRPRRTRGGRMESEAQAQRRGDMDVAMLSIMRDAMLRRGEAAALMWGDIRRWDDDTGRVTVRRSKTDQSGEGAVLFLSVDTMRALDRIRPQDAGPWSSVFRLTAGQINRRLQRACKEAGYAEGFSGHSCRVGMSIDLVRGGAALPELMAAGRWQNTRMPARYTRAEAAGHNAVARWHERRTEQ